MNALDGLFIQFLWNQLFHGNASQAGQMQKTMSMNICDEILTRNIALPFLQIKAKQNCVEDHCSLE
jgi:hypothetical protein